MEEEEEEEDFPKQGANARLIAMGVFDRLVLWHMAKQSLITIQTQLINGIKNLTVMRVCFTFLCKFKDAIQLNK